ncbi:MAG TPA: hypothetical protein VL181_04170 [Holophagaceae bacterium]|nr:hypothetical protein [Holophagaceae bacterium]
MRPTLSVLTLLPVALSAQAPVQTPAPAPAAPSLDAQFKAQSPAINALLKSDPEAALAKVEALIPAQPPVFDKSSIAGAQASINDFEALTDLYSLGANAAMDMGQWEKARDYAGKAKSTAQATSDNAQEPLMAFQDTWKKAQADAQKNLDEMDALSKTQNPTPEQAGRLAFLQKNQAIYAGNVAHGKQMVDAVDTSLKGLKAAPGNYDAAIADIDKHLKEEADYLDKVKGDKKVYANALLKSAGTNPDKAAAMAGLRRALVVDPTNKAVARKIEVMLGKAKDEPVKSGHHKKTK